MTKRGRGGIKENGEDEWKFERKRSVAELL
jgi:hypothetical protein